MKDQAGSLVTFHLTIAGHRHKISIRSEEIRAVHEPLLAQLNVLADARGGRAVVYLAGAPGCGKTTLAAVWEELARTKKSHRPIQALPLDGFHYPNAVLDSRTVMREGREVPLRLLKGSPESYDRESLELSLQALAAGRLREWPLYDRRIHDPVPGAIAVAASGILVIEGNYLLLDEPGWRDLGTYTDLGIFIECDEEMAQRDILGRHQRGGRSLQSAMEHFALNDVPNRLRILSARRGIDVLLRYDPGRSLQRLR